MLAGYPKKVQLQTGTLGMAGSDWIAIAETRSTRADLAEALDPWVELLDLRTAGLVLPIEAADRWLP